MHQMYMVNLLVTEMARFQTKLFFCGALMDSQRYRHGDLARMADKNGSAESAHTGFRDRWRIVKLLRLKAE